MMVSGEIALQRLFLVRRVVLVAAAARVLVVSLQELVALHLQILVLVVAEQAELHRLVEMVAQVIAASGGRSKSCNTQSLKTVL